jgi:phenylalanine-4-hydroxylase
MTRLHPRGACRAYLENFPKCEFTESDVPQLADVNKRLEATGWRIRPAAGLLHPRAFLNGLAFGGVPVRVAITVAVEAAVAASD